MATQLLSLFGEDQDSDLRGEDNDLGFLPIPGMATALLARRMIKRRKAGKRGKAMLFGGEDDLRGEDNDLGFLPIPGMATALLARRMIKRRKAGKRGKAMLFGGEEDLRGEDNDLGFLPIPGMATALLARRMIKRRKAGKRGKAMLFGAEDDLRGDDDLYGDLRGDDEDIGFAPVVAAVGKGLFKGIQKFGKSKTFKALQKSKLGKKLSVKRKKKSAGKSAGPLLNISPEQFKKDFQEAAQATDMTVVPKSELKASEDLLNQYVEQSEKQSVPAQAKKLLTPKNIAIGGGALVGTVVLVKVLTRKKAVPVQVGLGTYPGCRK